MTRAEAPGFISHAKLMLQRAVSLIDEEWDDPDVQMSPLQTEMLRANIKECSRLIRQIEPFARAFESVTDARKVALTTK